jgi:hypothetical protein
MAAQKPSRDSLSHAARAFNRGGALMTKFDDTPEQTVGRDLIILDDKSPTGIKGIDIAQLPEAYKRFKQELAACLRIDDSKQWASNAEALAAWSRMHGDRDAERLWKGFRQLSQRRYGALRKLATRQGGDRKSQYFRQKIKVGNSQFDRQASDFANVPAGIFESEVEKGATDSHLTKLGREAAAKQRAKARKADRMNLPRDDFAHPYQTAFGKLLILVERVLIERKSINVKHALAGLDAAKPSASGDKRITNFAKDCKAIADWFGGMAAPSRKPARRKPR